MHLVHRRLTGAVIVIAVAVCGCLTGPAFAQQSAAPRTVRCSLPHGAEGNLSLAYVATRVSCSTAAPVVTRARIVHGCNLLRSAGCTVDHFVCRDPYPQLSSYVSAGDIIHCTQGDKAIKFEEPG